MDTTGGTPRRLTESAANDFVAAWSSDGQSVYFTSDRSRTHEIWKMPVEGGDAIQVTKAGGWVPRESWDGTQLYFLRGPSKLSIWRMPVAGGDATEVVPGPFTDQFAWDVSRTGLYYARTTSNGYVIQYLGFNANTPTEVFRDESETQHIYLAVSPDEETILFGARPTTRSELMLVENFR